MYDITSYNKVILLVPALCLRSVFFNPDITTGTDAGFFSRGGGGGGGKCCDAAPALKQ